MTIENIIIIIIVAILVISLTIWLIIDNKNKKVILAKSQRVASLLALNKNYKFSTIQSKYSNHQNCNSKRQLDHLSMDEYLIALIDANESFYRNIINTISSNISKYNNYTRQTQTIKSSATEEFCNSFGFTLTKFLKYEERVFKSKLLRKPQDDVVVYCKATYTSPQGKNHYWKEQSYHYSELKSFFDRTVELKAQRQTRQYQIKVERAKMTDSLRYDILKRDGFRCQICGSSAQDGVKLHVDHIIPVAKGGQTIASNLRTLCDRCNMGKSDKL